MSVIQWATGFDPLRTNIFALALSLRASDVQPEAGGRPTKRQIREPLGWLYMGKKRYLMLVTIAAILFFSPICFFALWYIGGEDIKSSLTKTIIIMSVTVFASIWHVFTPKSK